MWNMVEDVEKRARFSRSAPIHYNFVGESSMRITSRASAIAFFITLGACLVGVALVLNVSWILRSWRDVAPLVLGIIFFLFLIA